MKNTMIELISDDELIDLLVDTAHEASVPSESNFLAAVRDELKARLTKRAVDVACACGSSATFRDAGSSVDICSWCKSPRN